MVNIVKAQPPVGVGVCEDGSELLILNGHLFVGDKCEVAIIKDNNASLVCLNYSVDEITDHYGDKDGLIPLTILREHRRSKSGGRIFELDKYICFSDRSCNRLLEETWLNDLKNKCLIKITNSPVQSFAAVKWYGVDFISAIKKCMEEGVSKSYHYSLGKKRWDDGVSADFLVRLTMNKENKIELDAWQAVIDDGRLYYCHGIMHENRNSFHHLDFAYHHTTKYKIEQLFDGRTNRPELSDKSKIFRIDDNEGRISFDFAFSLMTEFFPLDELIDEYYLKETVGQSEIN